MKNRKYLAIIIFFGMVCLPSALQADELSFESTQYYGTGTGSWPCAIAVGDFNNDGYQDIVTANYNTDNVSILLGNGDGTFQTPPGTYGTGDTAYSPAVGDLNGDGNSDIVVSNAYSDNVSVLLGNGDGTFQTAVNYTAFNGPRWVSLGDLNGDDIPDIVTANAESNDVSVLLGNGDGTFQASTNYEALGEPMEIEIYDLDNDGDQDVAVACYAGDNMAVLLNDGSGNLGSAAYYTAGDGTRAAAVGDLNRDGAPDIVTGNYVDGNNYVTVLLGIVNEPGTFQGPVNYTSGNDNTRSVALIDFNNDGFHDIAVTNYNEGTLSVLLGNGDGTFQTAVEYAADAAPHGIAVGDFNKDGRPDIATNNGDANNIAVLINNSVAGSNLGESFVTDTQEYYTSGFPSPATFYFQTGNNLFEEADGTLHAAYVENYELYYLQSTDGGETWTKENIASAHNGDVYSAALTVDHDGNVFIGFTAHDLFNYDNPPANDYGSEWYYDLYSVNNISGSWAEELIYTHSTSNFGAKAMAMVVDGDNNVHLFANRYGWITTGGTAWEWIRNSVSDTWGAQITAADPSGPTDHFIYDYYRPLVDSTGMITLILSRANSTSGDEDYLFYVQSDGDWSGITAIDQPNRDYASTYHFDAAIDGSDQIYLVYLKDLVPGVPQILFSTNFGVATPIYTGQSGERIYDLKLHSDSAGNLTLFVRRGLATVQGSSIGHLYPTSVATKSSSGSWSTLKSLPSSAPDGDVFYLSVARTDTLSGEFNSVKLTYFDREIWGQTGPYGPDNLYFNGFKLFGPQQIIATDADGIWHAIAADVDGDGDQDAVTALQLSSGTTSIVWYENTDGAGTFGSQNFIASEAASSDSSIIDAADIDGDGDIDIVSGSPGDDMIYWYENTDGNGAFASAVSVATIANGNGSRVFVSAADIDDDGYMDIVSSSMDQYGTGTIAWHRNTLGDGTSWTEYDITSLSDFTATYASSARAADIDGDGDLDVLSSANSDVNDNDIAWYENTAGDGSAWTAYSITTSADYARFVYAADIDGDNDLDVLSATLGGIAWYENTDGMGTFGPQQVITTANYTKTVYAADLDLDGDMDVLTVVEGMPGYNEEIELNWYENISGGSSWAVHTVDTDQSTIVNICDLDGDGDIDLLSGMYDTDIITWYENLSPNQAQQYSLNVSISGNGTVVLAPPGGSYNYGTIVTLTANADSGWSFAGWSGVLTGTTNPTTITMDADKTVTANMVQLSFSTAQSYPAGAGAEDLAIGDLNGDGFPDVIAATYQTGSDISVLINNGDGTYQNGVSYAAGTEPCSVTIDDFDGDGIPDIATANYGSNNVSILLGNGDGTFQSPLSYSVGGTPESVGTGDFDGDGNADIAAANSGGSNISILLGNGDGTFQPAVNYTVGTTPMQLEIDDFNNDGTPDIVTANTDSDNISVLIGNGDGTFEDAANYAAGDMTRSPAIGDLNNDGYPDIVAVNRNSDYVSVFINNGDGTFQTAVNYTAGIGALSVAIGDFNDDGANDIAVSSDSNIVSIILNNGDGTFNGLVNYSVGDAPYAVAVGDFNLDYNLDIATANADTGNVSILLNNTFPGRYDLIIATTGNGIVTPAPVEGPYADGTTVTLTATPYTGWIFAGWSGNLTGTTNPTTITMDSYKTVTATFTVVNNPPLVPTGVSPEEEGIVTSDSVVLTASAFTDPDSGDSQVASYWMIRRADSVYGRLDYDESFNFEAISGDMTSHEVTGLSSGMKYIWKVGYVDSGSGEITWSDEYSFKVGESISEAMPEVEEGTEIVNYKMMSFPYWLDDPSALSVFDIDYDTRYYRIGHYEADRNSGEYVEIDDPDLDINPGEAMWVLAREGIDVFADGIPVSDAYDIEVPLCYNETNGNGWNQIGCPNAKEYMWGDIEVIEYGEGGEILFGPAPLSELEQVNEYIDIRIWEWVGGGYDSYTPDDEFILVPYEGYWVRARKANVHLNFPMSVQLTGNRLGGNVFAAYFGRAKGWIKDRIVATPLAVADSGDSPPMPMGTFTDSNESRTSQGGCFIGTAAHGSPCQVILSGLLVLLLGIIGRMLLNRPKKWSLWQ